MTCRLLVRGRNGREEERRPGHGVGEAAAVCGGPGVFGCECECEEERKYCVVGNRPGTARIRERSGASVRTMGACDV